MKISDGFKFEIGRYLGKLVISFIAIIGYFSLIALMVYLLK